MEKQYAGKTIQVNEEGYLKNFSEWTPEVGEEIAKENNITLGARHWDVLKYLQGEFKAELPISIRKIGKSNVVDIKEFYALFPQGPLKTASKIAGIPKPASCL
jgi:dissimilatory sulfite reductase related protein